MSSPPRIENLDISENAPSSTSTSNRPGSSRRPPSPSPTPGTEPSDPIDDLDAKNMSRPEDTPPATPALEQEKSSSEVKETAAENGDPLAAPTASSSSKPLSPPPAPTRTATAPAKTSSPGPNPAFRPSMNRPGMTGPMGMRGANARGGAPMPTRIPASLQAKMDAVVASRAGQPATANAPGVPNPNATSMSALLRSQALGGGKSPQGPNAGPLGLAARRAVSGGPGAFRPSLGAMGGPPSRGLGRPGSGISGRRGPPGGMTLSDMKGPAEKSDSKFTDFGKIMDPSGSLKFSKKAVLHSKGVDFEDGKSFKINMDEIEVVGELGRGNYGSVQQVIHRPTGVTMAMKEIRLELDESKLNGIIMELDILHRAAAPEIVEFYGAFTIESCVYYCMEFMDASLDTLTGGGQPAKAGETEANEEGAEVRVPEDVLRRITLQMIKGLKFLKDELQIMHRDVKPTNVLINKKGEVKLCDFGVSGQLEKSLAKTNIGCQSYMAPERIKGESQNQLSTYTVSSDVWSVGLSIIELARGCYPYPPETFANVFAQLTAIVHGPAPTLPPGYSADAHDFVAKCLTKDPNGRPTYAQLLEHPFLLADKDSNVDMVGWVAQALERRAARTAASTPASEA